MENVFKMVKKNEGKKISSNSDTLMLRCKGPENGNVKKTDKK